MNSIRNLDPYKSYLDFKGKKSEDTVSSYTSDFKLFHSKMGVYLHEATEEHIMAYFELRRNEGVSDRTLSRYKGGFSAFFKWLNALHKRVDNPSLILLTFPIDPPEGKPKALNLAQQEVLLNSLKWESLRDNQASLFVMMGLDTGLRRSEMMRMKWADIDLKKSEIKSIRKGRKKWTGRIPTRLLAILKAYEARLKKGGIQSEWIFFNHSHPEKHVQKSAFGRWLEAIKERCGFDNSVNFSPHVLRHILCTRLADGGVPDHVAIKITGHAGVEVYKKNYVKVEDEAVDQASKDILG